MIQSENNVLKTSGRYLSYLILFIFFFGPTSWLILSSISADPSYSWSVPDTVTLQNYVELFTESDVLVWLKNSTILGVGTMIATIVLSTLAAYPLSRVVFPGKTTFMYIILLARVMPITAVIIPIFSIAIVLGMVNTFWGTISILTAMQLPISIWIMKDFVDTIPAEVEEAAWLDGASRLGGIRYIIFPLMGPPIAVTGLLAFLAGWGDFLIPLILLRSPDKFPIAMGLFRAFHDLGNVNFAYLTAISVIYSIPSVGLYLVARGYLIKGIASN
ncbi:MAG: carbohydrate ABC transporter permease [Chloroflexota bacterium]